MTAGDSAPKTREGQLFRRQVAAFGGDSRTVPLHLELAGLVRFEAAAHRKPAVWAGGGL